MKFIIPADRSQLLQILINNNYFQGMNDSKSLRAFLNNCGLGDYCNSINFTETLPYLIPRLCDELSKIYLENEDKKLGLIFFLESITCDYDFLFNFTIEEKQFIQERVIQRWKPSQTTYKNHERTTTLLAEGRKKHVPHHPPLKIDRGIIVNFDLKETTLQFNQRIGYQGTFAFSLGGDRTLLDEYIILRMQRELQNFTGRPHKRFEVSLHCRKILENQNIEHYFLKRYPYERLTNVFEDSVNSDVLLVVWNYDIPSKIMQPVAQSFWQEIEPQLLPIMQIQNLCFVLILANIGNLDKSPIEGFISLPTPAKFEFADLASWFSSQLKQEGIANNWIDYYLNRLEDQCENLVGTYQEMKEIIHEMQGGFRLYG